MRETFDNIKAAVQQYFAVLRTRPTSWTQLLIWVAVAALGLIVLWGLIHSSWLLVASVTTPLWSTILFLVLLNAIYLTLLGGSAIASAFGLYKIGEWCYMKAVEIKQRHPKVGKVQTAS